jgi:hypothetical protein
MLAVHAVDWFELRGRGWVAVIDGVDGLNPRSLVGQQVAIDGVLRTVRGVETHAVPDHAVTGRSFGLLVDRRVD